VVEVEVEEEEGLARFLEENSVVVLADEEVGEEVEVVVLVVEISSHEVDEVEAVVEEVVVVMTNLVDSFSEIVFFWINII
jgi:hypothetical protein